MAISKSSGRRDRRGTENGSSGALAVGAAYALAVDILNQLLDNLQVGIVKWFAHCK